MTLEMTQLGPPLGRDPLAISTHGMRIDYAVRCGDIRAKVDCCVGWYLLYSTLYSVRDESMRQ